MLQLLGCVAVVCIPMPVIFYVFGKKIRAKSKFAPAPDIAQDRRRDEEARLGGAEGGSQGGSETSGNGAVEKEKERTE